MSGYGPQCLCLALLLFLLAALAAFDFPRQSLPPGVAIEANVTNTLSSSSSSAQPLAATNATAPRKSATMMETPDAPLPSRLKNERCLKGLISRLDADASAFFGSRGCKASHSNMSQCSLNEYLPFPSRYVSFDQFLRAPTAEFPGFSCFQLRQLRVEDFHVFAPPSEFCNRSLVYLSTDPDHIQALQKLLDKTEALQPPPYFFLLCCNDNPVFPRWALDNPRVLLVFAPHSPPQIAHRKLIPLPLGLRKEWVESLQQFQRRAASTPMSRTLFVKFTLQAPQIRIARRKQAIRALQRNGLLGNPASVTQRIRHPQFYQQLLSSQYILSPPGIALDTHRSWEALVLGRVPLMLANIHPTVYSELPVLQVSSWSEVNPKQLKESWARLKNGTYNVNKVLRVWWLSHILQHCLRA
eukprot:TRINITY_DN6718_c0_g1_i1.p1 TRINITY_DN6718_c0_g1~~TRINITY_DN6718_c0_g1_i1.p1  ORF type:complete len:412 (+),score=42.82 TRINITY_DN6718_c0_g1_i1:24-1259(+)